MFPALLGLSLAALSALGFLYCTVFWLGPWRKQHSYSAHAFTLISGTMFVLVALIAAQQIYRIASDAQCPFDLAISVIVFVVSFFSVAFARGYFVPKERV